jgi:hypothetical protein
MEGLQWHNGYINQLYGNSACVCWAKSDIAMFFWLQGYIAMSLDFTVLLVT